MVFRVNSTIFPVFVRALRTYLTISHAPTRPTRSSSKKHGESCPYLHVHSGIFDRYVVWDLKHNCVAGMKSTKGKIALFYFNAEV